MSDTQQNSAYQALNRELADRLLELRAELTDRALATGQLSGLEFAAAFFVAGIELASAALAADLIPEIVWRGQLESQVEKKRKLLAARRNQSGGFH